MGPLHRYVAPGIVEAVSCKDPPEQMGPLFETAGDDGCGVIVRRSVPVIDWPSGFVTVMSCCPALAPAVERFSLNCVGESNRTPITETPPVTEAAMWFEKPGPPVSGPGSKKPDPETDVPVRVTWVDGLPEQMLDVATLTGVAGGGAFNSVTRIPQEFVSSQYS